MIKTLYIRNYAIIESLEMQFSNGLTIITGETGAGKSILLGALGLIRGNRADTKALYDENDKCVVEARFHVRPYQIQSFFEVNDLDYDDEVVIRREILPNGKTRGFINDTPVNLKVMQDLSNFLLDIHQQFDTLSMQESSFQIKAIDALADNKQLIGNYQQIFQKYQKDVNKLQELIARNRAATQETDFIKFQFEELETANLSPQEQEILELEQVKLNNAEDIKRYMVGAFQTLSESELAVISQLQGISQSLNAIKKFDPEIDTLYQRFESALVELQDLSKEFEDIAEQTEFNEERNHLVQERLDLIYRLQKKHQVTSIASLLEIKENLAFKLQDFSDLSTGIEALEIQIEATKRELEQLADQISERRRRIVSAFEANVFSLLGELAMEHAQLKVEIQPTDQLKINGRDDIQFFFAANKGSRLQLIKDVASGGELSRLALILKSLVASAIPLPTLIFDEIDTGISGDIALKMGKILRKLSNEHQVVTITHSPQVASKADVHYFVFKKVKEERTVTNVRLLNKEDRIRSIAVMLSQNPPSDSALENARELIEQT